MDYAYLESSLLKNHKLLHLYCVNVTLGENPIPNHQTGHSLEKQSIS